MLKTPESRFFDSLTSILTHISGSYVCEICILISIVVAGIITVGVARDDTCPDRAIITSNNRNDASSVDRLVII